MEAVFGVLTTVANIALSLVIPGGILTIIGLFGFQVYKYVMTLQVQGKANEWVVVMNNGVMKQAAVGLQTMLSPGDTVAIYPSKVNKVNFATQQVTKEMSGLEVSSMICWVVNREGDGPMKAYVTLGKELESDNPRQANELISKMASAVIRNQISNSTTDDILKNRDKLRTAIRDEISSVTKGWGVWLETIEITDAKILSQSLFKDLQCQYLEDQNKKATMLKMEVDNSLELERSGHMLQNMKRRKDQEIVTLKRQQDAAFKEKQGTVQSQELYFKIRAQEVKAQRQEQLYNASVRNTQAINGFKWEVENKKTQTQQTLVKMQQQAENLKQQLAFNKQTLLQEIQKGDQEAEYERQRIQDQFKFKKELIAQPGYLDKRRGETIQNIYAGLRSNHEVNYQGADPICQVIDTMIRSTKEGLPKDQKPKKPGQKF